MSDIQDHIARLAAVSMKSGLEGRNNCPCRSFATPRFVGLNEVRPGRPEQYRALHGRLAQFAEVSMKSGLEGRNNPEHPTLSSVTNWLSQ